MSENSCLFHANSLLLTSVDLLVSQWRAAACAQLIYVVVKVWPSRLADQQFVTASLKCYEFGRSKNLDLGQSDLGESMSVGGWGGG